MYVDPGGYVAAPITASSQDPFGTLAYWQNLFANDPLYQQQVTSEFGQIPGDTAAFASGALQDAARSGLLGVKDASGNRPFLEQLRAAFTKRGIKDPFSALSDPNALNEAALASEALNKSEITPWAQGQRKLADLTRTDTNELAARGILRSGENTYRTGNRQLLGEQTQYGILQDLIDQIEGRNAGLLAAQKAHQKSLWEAANSAAGRFSAQQAQASAKAEEQRKADEQTRTPPVEYPGDHPVPTNFPSFNPPSNYVPGNENVAPSIAGAQTGMPAFTPIPKPPPTPKYASIGSTVYTPQKIAQKQKQRWGMH